MGEGLTRGTKQGVSISAGIRKQLVQNRHRMAMGSLEGAKGPGGLKNHQTHLYEKKKIKQKNPTH